MDAGIVTPPRKKQAQSGATASQGLRTAFYRSGARGFSGYVVDPNDPDRRFTVEILVDGYPVRTVRADAFVHELKKLVGEPVGDSCYGFSCSLLDAAANDSAVVEARLANVGTAVGTPVELARASDTAPPLSERGFIRWLGGLRFSGWLAGHDESAMANIHVDGTLVTRVRPTAWSHVGTADEDARPVRAFDFHLPERFADGCAHQVALTDEAGENIGGNPLVFIAYADGLREAVAGLGISEEERLRAKLFDELLPMSVPFSQYQGWRERFPILSGPPVAMQGAVIVVGPGAMEDTLESLNEQTHTDWVAASLPQTAEPTGLRTELARAFLDGDGADCEFVVFALAGTVFAPTALQRIASAFTDFPNAQAVYADLDLPTDDGSVWPLAFPAFDYERMLEQGYCAYLFALRRVAVDRSLEGGASSLYRIFNSILDDGTASHSDIVHLPGPLGTLPEFDKNAAGLALSCRHQRTFAAERNCGSSSVACQRGPARGARHANIRARSHNHHHSDT